MVKFNNKAEARRTGMILSLFFMVAIGLIGAYYLAWLEPNKSLEVALWVYFFVVTFIYSLGGFCYVDVDINEARFDIKYYNLFVLGRQYKRIVVPIDRVKQIKVRRGLGFIGAGIMVRARIKGKLAMFPTVGLSACSKAQFELLKDFSEKFKDSADNE